MVHKQRYVPNSRVSRHGYALDGTPQHNDHQNNNASSFTMKFYLKVRYKDLNKKSLLSILEFFVTIKV